MTFRHPLRNEWDKHAPEFARLAKGAGRNAVMARAMLDIVPAFLTIIERERDKATPADELFDAVAAVSGTMIENAIEAQVKANALVSPRTALHRMLARIHDVVAPQVTARKVAGLILPPGYGS